MTNVIAFTGTRIRSQETRPVMCPDGVLRFITLHAMFWDTLAYVQEHHNIGHWHDLIAYCWDIAGHYKNGSLRERLQHAFAFDICCLANIANNVENKIANDNWIEPDGRMGYLFPPEALRH